MGLPNQLKIQSWVKTQVSPRRFKHIQGVVKAAHGLALRYRLPLAKALPAAWLHDCGKELTRAQMKSWLKKGRFKLDRPEMEMPGLWHPHVGAAIAIKKWGIKDKSILEAIRCHTLGRPAMGPLARLIFVSDFVEKGRSFPGVEMARQAAKESLNKAVLMKAAMTLTFLLQKKIRVHPRLVETWNYFLKMEKNEKS